MTDRETLFHYRLNEAEETLADAYKMLNSGVGPLGSCGIFADDCSVCRGWYIPPGPLSSDQ